MKTNKKTHNHNLSRLAAFVLLSSLITLAACGGGNKKNAQAEKCKKECEAVNRNREDGRICLGCFPTRGKPTSDNNGDQVLHGKTDADTETLKIGTSVYSGLTTQAHITEENGKEIASSSWLGGAGVNIEKKNNAEEPSGLRTVAFSQALVRTLFIKDAEIVHDRSVIKNLKPLILPSVSGSCGGTAAFETAAGESGNLKGKISLNQYCEKGAVMSGNIAFTGQGDASKVTLNMVFNDVSILTKSDSFSVAGTVLLNVNKLSSANFLLDLHLADLTTGKTYLFENYRFSLLAEPTLGDPVFTEVNVKSGKFYNPDFGYVNVLTTSPFLIYGLDEWPSSGVLTAEGKYADSVTLTLQSNSSYQVILEKAGSVAK